jgi:DnaJ family protein C protein 11
LSDPKARIIYDTYGEEGLNASWEVGPRYKTTEEVNNKDICVHI